MLFLSNKEKAILGRARRIFWILTGFALMATTTTPYGSPLWMMAFWWFQIVSVVLVFVLLGTVGKVVFCDYMVDGILPWDTKEEK